MKQIALLFFTVWGFLPALWGQNTGGNPTLVAFNAVSSDSQVILSWTIRSGFSCTSVYVLHSTDSVNFVPVYEYPGICGATNQDESYSFTHTSPASGKNYYKMDLGNYGVSGVLRINLVDYGDAGFTITGSTAGFLKINFRNPGNATFILELENLSGQLIYRRTGIQGSETEFPIIPETDGIIIVRLIGNDGTRFTGKWLALSH